MSNWLAAWTKIIKESRLKLAVPFGTEYARTLTTEDLKLLWDSYDGAETSDERVSGEAVHMVLNERKEGSYCAV